MNYKTVTLLIFVLLAMLTMYLMFNDTGYGLVIIGAVVPFLVIVQVFVVLTAKETGTQEYGDGKYDKE